MNYMLKLIGFGCLLQGACAASVRAVSDPYEHVELDLEGSEFLATIREILRIDEEDEEVVNKEHRDLQYGPPCGPVKFPCTHGAVCAPNPNLGGVDWCQCDYSVGFANDTNSDVDPIWHIVVKYGLHGYRSCIDADECKNEFGFKNVCAMAVNGRTGGGCEDRDPEKGSYMCFCKAGYLPRSVNPSPIENGKHGPEFCVNVNECEVFGPQICGDTTTTMCVDTDGGFECQCKPGFVRVHETCLSSTVAEGLKWCYSDRLLDNGNNCTEPERVCDPILDRCVCIPGYFQPAGAGGQCQNINECARQIDDKCDRRGRGGPNPRSRCIDLNPGYRCECNEGFEDSPHTPKGTNCIELQQASFAPVVPPTPSPTPAPPAPCSTVTCGAGARCVASVDACRCLPGYAPIAGSRPFACSLIPTCANSPPSCGLDQPDCVLIGGTPSCGCVAGTGGNCPSGKECDGLSPGTCVDVCASVSPPTCSDPLKPDCITGTGGVCGCASDGPDCPTSNVCDGSSPGMCVDVCLGPSPPTCSNPLKPDCLIGTGGTCGCVAGGPDCTNSYVCDGLDPGSCVDKCDSPSAPTCSGDTPQCISGSGGTCGCAVDGECTGGKVCDKTNFPGTCRLPADPCVGVTCVAPKPECRVIGGSPVCGCVNGVGCVGDDVCDGNVPGQCIDPCDVTGVSAVSCSGSTPVCVPGTSGSCGCTGNGDCPGQVCDTTIAPAGQCVNACDATGRAACPAGAPDCINQGATFACGCVGAGQQNCANGMVCDGNTPGQCVDPCDLTGGSAVSCGGSTPVCVPGTSGSCGCTGNVDCPGQVCDTTIAPAGQCVTPNPCSPNPCTGAVGSGTTCTNAGGTAQCSCNADTNCNSGLICGLSNVCIDGANNCGDVGGGTQQCPSGYLCRQSNGCNTGAVCGANVRCLSCSGQITPGVTQFCLNPSTNEVGTVPAP